MREPWWKWDWDVTEAQGQLEKYHGLVKRWRRGWVTLYKFVSRLGNDGTETVEWRLYFPFNVSVGFEYDRRVKA